MPSPHTRFPASPLAKAMNGTSAIATLATGIELRKVELVPTHNLTPNPLSEQYFKELTVGELEKLAADIEKRGILVPLIATLDNVLLSGHNRLAVAKELKLTHVPVQYVVKPLSSEEEREFIVKDNLLRRQLSSEERIALYKILYPDFENRLATKGGQPRGLVAKIDIITVEQIAKDTAQSPGAVAKQIQKFKRDNETVQARASQRELNPQEIERAKERNVMQSAKASMERVQEDVKAFSPDFQIRAAKLLIETGNKMLEYAKKQKPYK